MSPEGGPLLPKKSDIISHEDTSQLGKCITLEKLLSDKSLLNKLTTAIASSSTKGDTLIDFGESIGQISLGQVEFTVAYEIGYVPYAIDRMPDIETYVNLLADGKPTEAEESIKAEIAKQSLRGMAEKIREGASALPSIIPGAPQFIQHATPLTDYQDGSEQLVFNRNPTDKTYTLMNPTREKIFPYLTDESLDDIRSLFRGRTVVDLGAGSQAKGLVLASYFESKNYIGVEPNNATRLLLNASELCKEGEIKKIDNIHIESVDMLAFLKAMPTGVKDLTIFISGIDFDILYVRGGVYGGNYGGEKLQPAERYAWDVMSEINRVLGEGSALITHDTQIGLGLKERGLEDAYDLKKIEFRPDSSGDIEKPSFASRIYKKITKPEPVQVESNL